MEPWVFIILLVFGLPIVLAIWLITRAISARDRIEELSRRMGELEAQLSRLQQAPPHTQSEPCPASILAQKLESTQSTITAAPPMVASSPIPVAAPIPTIVPVEKPRPVRPPVETHAPEPTPQREQHPPTPPPIPRMEPPTPSEPAINWEHFMGVKGLAWVAGLALFLGIVFFVKYSFERNWITPELRVAMGFAAGVALLGGGAWLQRRKQYLVGAHTLCATGVLVLYATTFSCRAIYKFPFFTLVPTFALMALITATAFLLAVRLNALVVAVLGMLGGFLTPILLSTGEDNPAGLFGYIAILDIGLILVALNRRWLYLIPLAALGTILMQVGWTAEFITRESYFSGNKIFIPLSVLVGFNLLFLVTTWWQRRRTEDEWWTAAASLGLLAGAFAFTLYFLSFNSVAQRPWIIFSFVFLIDLMVLALVVADRRTAFAQPFAGLAVFALLMIWTVKSLSADLLYPALAFYFLLAGLHTVVPLLLQRRGYQIVTSWNQMFPPLALFLVLIPIMRLADVPLIVWPFVLLVDVLAIALAVLTASILPVVVVLMLSLAATGALIFKIPPALTGLGEFLVLVALFAVAFACAGMWLRRKFPDDDEADSLEAGADALKSSTVASAIPLFSAAFPFLLLIMAVQRLAVSNPTPIFALAALLTVILLGLTVFLSAQWLPMVGLACVVALEATWHFKHFTTANASTALVWYLGFHAILTVFPFLFIRKFGEKTIPWATAALVGVPQFFLVYRVVETAWPNEVMGLLPAAFAVPALLSLALLYKLIPQTNNARTAQLAWMAGVALFFITLIFPIQFEHQWITLGWALEGVALLWLFHRVPHNGLRYTGIGLLIAVFVRLAFNRAVLDYHPRSETPILNWYLYTYGIATVCFFVASRLLSPPRNTVMGYNARPLLLTLGTILAFLLLNIEIADYFSAPGSTLTFQFSGNFARDMTYSIAWALFALVLLIAGIKKDLRPPRYAALALLCVTLLKLFFHDLAQLSQLYRIGAFIGVAVIAMLASFAYQRFFASTQKSEAPKS
jgi:uncharacterized membrane protein